MIYVTGDKHGSFNDYERIKKYCKQNNTTKKDYIIILGDAGINYYTDVRDLALKEKLKGIPITFLCVHGNHEVRPENLVQYKEVDMFEGKVYVESDFPNIIFLKDGETYTIENKTFLVLGGAYSVDKDYRILNGFNWFPDEQISEDTRNLILQKVKGKSYDYILSHTCPYEWRPTELFLSCINQLLVDNSMEHWLSDIEKNITYKKWLFGHYHGDKKVSLNDNKVYQMLYNDINIM